MASSYQKILKIALPSLTLIFGTFIFGFLVSAAGQSTATGRPVLEAVISVAKIILMILGVGAVVLMAYAGYGRLSSQGDPEKNEQAKKILIIGGIGLAATLFFYLLAMFLANRFAGPIISDNPEEIVNPFDRFSSITSISSVRLNWQRNISYGFSGVVGVPSSADLKISAWAKYKGGEIGNFSLAQGAGSSTLAVFSKLADFNPATAPEEKLKAETAWNTSAYALASIWRLKSSFVNLKDNKQIDSSVVRFKIRPEHCFDGIKNTDETKSDCGNSCGFCANENCSDKLSGDDCASGACLADSYVCAGEPVIDSIEASNGARGNYITIFGRNFGETTGSVWFGDILGVVNLPLDCGQTWTNHQIIVAVPDGLAMGSTTVKVVTNSGYGNLTSNNKDFLVNETSRPGICSLAPMAAVYPAKATIFGFNFPGVTNNRVVTWSLASQNITSTYPTLSDGWLSSNKIVDQVPAKAVGSALIRVYSDAEVSNPYLFLVSRGGLNDPCGFTGEPGRGFCSVSRVCQPGLSCNLTSCTCQKIIPVCGNGVVEGNELCDGRSFKKSGNCSSYGLGDGPVTCDSNCRLDKSQCRQSPEVPAPTYSIYSWSFVLENPFDQKAPYVLEDCNRNLSCTGSRLPSPTPWNQEWNTAKHPSLEIREPKACSDALISASFSRQMDEKTLTSQNIIVLKCDNTTGVNCQRIAGGILAVNGNNGLEGNNAFKFVPAQILAANSIYKIILTSKIKSYGQLALVDKNRIVNSRHCNINYNDGGSSKSINDAAYCWDFQTRINTDRCLDGCVDCAIDPTTMYYKNATSTFNSYVDSADNVCLLLNRANDWSWNTDKPDKTNVNQSSMDFTDCTAKGETIFDPISSYAKIIASLPASGKSGYCKNYNDFTNPMVVQSPTCSSATQSPSPYDGATDACLNSLISVRFNRPMLDSSLKALDSKGNLKNLIVEKCSSNSSTTRADIESGKNCQRINIDPKGLRVVKYSDVSSLVYSLGGIQAEGIIFDKCATDLWQPNTWYRVVILGGASGVRGSKIKQAVGTSTWQEIEEPQGILQINPGKDQNFNYPGHSGPDYYWTFKTGSKSCDPASVKVLPSYKELVNPGDKSEYNALVQASNCNILNPYGYDFGWKSVFNLTDSLETGQGIAAISKIKNKDRTDILACNRNNFFSPIQEATAVSRGETNIKATILNFASSSLSGFGRLKVLGGVGPGQLNVIDHAPVGTIKCLNTPIQAKFDVALSSASVSNNFNVYRCLTSACNYDSLGSSPLSLSFGGFSSSSNEVTATATAGFATGTSYRVIITGGASGIKAFDGGLLASLNYNRTTTTGQGDSYSWTFDTASDAKVCSPETKFNPCDNGILEISSDPAGNFSLNNFLICQRTSGTIGLWQRIINRLESSLAFFMGKRAIAQTANFCPDTGYTPLSNINNFNSLEYYNGVSQGNERILDLIKKAKWDLGYYKVWFHDNTTSTFNELLAITNITKHCAVSKVKVDIWPQSNNGGSNEDNFFCYSDEVTGNKCGYKSGNPLLTDISASWNVDASSSAYQTFDYPYLKVNNQAVSDLNLAGNQHLYQAWAETAEGDLIKADNNFDWTWLSINPRVGFGDNDGHNSDYIGNSNQRSIQAPLGFGFKWLSAKNVGGETVLKVALDSNVSTTVKITNFLCNNPWPSPADFPYKDANLNHPDLVTHKNIDTNFSMYYCRDDGDPATTTDDLPALSLGAQINAPTSSPILLKEFLFPSSSTNPLEQGAVGVRVVPNDNHFSPAYWYDRFFIGDEQKGNTSPLLVDGYQAGRNGRTVYVNAANLTFDQQGNKNIYTNVYLISYSDNASDKIIGIYDQLLQNFHLNIGAKVDPKIIKYGTCSVDPSFDCLTDTDCPAGTGYCLSEKAKLIRDVKRLADLQTINVLLNNYYNVSRCSNDRNRSCSSDAGCPNDGTCGNFYPGIESGSYVSAHTFSTWPSWQATLGDSLGGSLPVDPLNQMIGCENKPTYEASTCWSETNKKVLCPALTTEVYAYASTSDSRFLSAAPEYAASPGSWQPNWVNVGFLKASPWKASASGLMDDVCKSE